MKRAFSLSLALLPALLTASPVPDSQKAPHRLNVLMIFVDDLRPALGCYGDKLVKSPNIDRFATTARLFRGAYCHQSVCGPSRASILTGRLPDNTGVWHNRNRFRDVHPDLVTLPQLFKNHGWHTQALGKVFSGNERELDPASWSASEILRKEGWPTYVLRSGGGRKKGAPLEKADVPDEGYADGKLASLAIETLAKLNRQSRPFFLAVGFFKPHLPFNAPKKYWDLYDPAAFALEGQPKRTRGAPPVAYPDHLELGGYQGVPEDEDVSPELARELRHGYYACVSYVDAQIGRLLRALNTQSLEDNTIVVLLGDHGYSLGEADHWCKDTNFELDTRTPLIIRAPGMKQPGVATEALTEYVDLYPTLAELAQLTPPSSLDGGSLAHLLDDPSAKGHDIVLSQFSRPFTRGNPEIMGYSIRTDTHRYTRWIEWVTSKVLAEELYDYTAGASASVQGEYLIERRNVVSEPSYAAKRDWLGGKMDEIIAARLKPVTLDVPAKKSQKQTIQRP